jgi:hypothetical protein
MINLEELTLNLRVVARQTFVDGNCLKNIIDHMTRLNKFTFNIHSRIHLHNQINLLSTKDIEKTLMNLKSNEIICCVDYFSELGEGQCHIYSYPYRLKEYDNITNHFPGGLFQYVRVISLFDEQPFEHEFFLKIAQSFPLLEKLTLVNQKDQKLNDNDEDFSIVKYNYLKELILYEAHNDYIEEFLLYTKTFLPNNVFLFLDHEQLIKVTNNFQRDETRINCSKMNYICSDEVFSLPKQFKNYFLSAHF